MIYLFISITIFLMGYAVSKFNLFVGIANDIFSCVNAISNLMIFILGMSLRVMESNNPYFKISDSYKSGLLIISLSCFVYKNFFEVPLYISYFISLLSRATFSIVFFEFFRNLKKHSKYLLYCGTYSMQIYVLHILFMIEEPELMKNLMNSFSGCALFIIPLLVCGIYSLISISLSIIISCIFSRDKYIAKLLFGSIIR